MEKIQTHDHFAKLIIPEYEQVIYESKKDSTMRFLNRLRRYHMNFGICSYVNHKLPTLHRNIQRKIQRIADRSNSNFYWGRTPEDCRTKKEMVEALQLRIRILKNQFIGKL